MNIALPRSLEDYVAELVETSGYQGSDEVVREALSEHQARRRGREAVMAPNWNGGWTRVSKTWIKPRRATNCAAGHDPGPVQSPSRARLGRNRRLHCLRTLRRQPGSLLPDGTRPRFSAFSTSLPSAQCPCSPTEPFREHQGVLVSVPGTLGTMKATAP